MNRIIDSWTIKFFKHRLGLMTLLSVWRLWQLARSNKINETKRIITVHLKKRIKGKVKLRSWGSDLATFKEVFTDQVYDCVVKHCGNCRCIVDLGANIGLSARYFCSQFPEAKVIAIEPDSDNFQLLLQNTNRLDSCDVINAAVWHEDSMIYIDRHKGEDRFASVRTTQEKSCSSKEIQGIKMTTLIDRYKIDEIDLLKVDIEGAEVQLLSTASAWMDKVRSIAIEFHGSAREDSRFDEIINTHGMEIVYQNSHTVLAKKVLNRDGLDVE